MPIGYGWTYNDVKADVESYNYKLLSDNYKDSITKLMFMCDKGHTYEATYSKFRHYGARCPICARVASADRKRLSYDEVRLYVESFGYKLLSTEYVGWEGRLLFQCSGGHTYESTYGIFRQGSRCPICSNRKWIYKTVSEFIKANGLELLSKEYVGYEGRLKMKCSLGHIFEQRLHTFVGKLSCPVCNVNARMSKLRHSIDNVKVYVESFGYKLLSTTYENGYESKIKLECPKGHIYEATFSNFKDIGNRCPVCSRALIADSHRLKYDVVRDRVESISGHVLLSEGYTCGDDLLKIKCPKGHEFEMSYNNFFLYRHQCPVCVRVSSRAEGEVTDFIKSITNLEICRNYRVYKPMFCEFDIYLPTIKCAFEYHGLWWHSERCKGSKYHKQKTDFAESKGVRLIQIFGDEWEGKRLIVESIIRSVLGKIENRVFARKCMVKLVTYKDAKNFLNNNHVHGAGLVGNIRFGLFSDDKLVSLMTFSKPSISKNQRNVAIGTWELYRQCSLINTSVVGGFSKLFRYFIINYNPKKVVSYCDRRYFVANSYLKCGFKVVSCTVPNYYYTDSKFRKHRFNFRKDKLVKMGYDNKLTEREITGSMGLYRIYDAGHIKLEWDEATVIPG